MTRLALLLILCGVSFLVGQRVNVSLDTSPREAANVEVSTPDHVEDVVASTPDHVEDSRPSSGDYLDVSEVMKLAYQDRYTNDQRELFLEEMRGRRTVFRESVKRISVASNRVTLQGDIFPTALSYIYKPYLKFREKTEFKKIWTNGTFNFDCRVSGYYYHSPGTKPSKAQSFDDCFVVDN